MLICIYANQYLFSFCFPLFQLLNEITDEELLRAFPFIVLKKEGEQWRETEVALLGLYTEVNAA